MPSNKYNFKLTPEAIAQLKAEVAGLKTAAKFGKRTPKEAETFMEMANQNKAADMHFLNCCFLGPTAMAEILLSSGINVNEMPLEIQVYYATVMEKMFGLSTKFKYDEKKNQFTAVRETEAGKQYGDVFTFSEEDLELGVWDKICALFGYTTDHAKRVEFVKDSLAAQKELLVGMNKGLVADKKNEYLKNNKVLYERNKEVLQQAKDMESVWRKAFFGENKVEDYKFDNGKKISALSACVAMYKNEYGENICENNPENISPDIKERMKIIVNKYQTIQKIKSGIGFQTLNVTTADVSMIKAISYKNGFKVDYEKNVPNLNELKNTKLKNQALMANNYVVLKMKAEMNKMFEGVNEYERNDQEKALAKESINMKIETKLYEDIKNEKYENIEKHLKTMHKDINLGENPSYSECITAADELGKAKVAELDNKIIMPKIAPPTNTEPELKNDDAGMERN